MSRIDDLVKQLCPRGVPREALGDVGTFVRGNGMQKSDLIETGFPAIHYGQIHTHYRGSATETISFVTHEFSKKLRKAEPGDLIIVTTSEDDEAVGKAFAWIGSTPVAVSGDAYIYRHTFDAKYISYAFQSDQFQDQKKHGITGTKVRRISGDGLAKISVPVPPLEVQREIVRILDRFTALEAELEAELEARRTQYEYYRNALLRLDGNSGVDRIDALITAFAPDGIERAELHRVAGYSTTRVAARDLDQTTFVGVDNLLPGRAGKIDASHLPNTARLTAYDKDDILIGNIRPYLKKVWIATHAGGCSGDVLAVRIHTSSKYVLTPAFLYYILSSDGFFSYDVKHSKGGKMPRGDKEAILRYRIPLPPLEVQREIVAILGKFDALVNDLSIGLPAELNARRKQYEYYRDRLLTFEELAHE